MNHMEYSKFYKYTQPHRNYLVDYVNVADCEDSLINVLSIVNTY